MRKSSLGFTLIELVIVIAIIGILGALTVPKFIDLSLQAKVSSANASLGALRAVIKSKYATSATGGVAASYPTYISATDFALGAYPKNPCNTNPAGPPVGPILYFSTDPCAGTCPCALLSSQLAFWYVTNPANSAYGRTGVFANTVNGWCGDASWC